MICEFLRAVDSTCRILRDLGEQQAGSQVLECKHPRVSQCASQSNLDVSCLERSMQFTVTYNTTYT